MTEKKVNYNAKTGDQIELKTSSGWIPFTVVESYNDWVSLKDGSGRDTYYTYDRLFEMEARFI